MEINDGKYMMAISDGMGKGKKAYEESSATIDILEKMIDAKTAGWTESEVQSFAGYEDIAKVQGEITALESSSQAKEEAKTKAEEKIAEVTKLVGKVTA
ncbi:hypothetical protein BGU85_24935, partial [Clostridioides difficile]